MFKLTRFRQAGAAGLLLAALAPMPLAATGDQTPEYLNRERTRFNCRCKSGKTVGPFSPAPFGIPSNSTICIQECGIVDAPAKPAAPPKPANEPTSTAKPSSGGGSTGSKPEPYTPPVTLPSTEEWVSALGAAGSALGAFFDERAAIKAAQAEARRQRDAADQQKFLNDKQSILQNMRGANPGPLRLKDVPLPKPVAEFAEYCGPGAPAPARSAGPAVSTVRTLTSLFVGGTGWINGFYVPPGQEQLRREQTCSLLHQLSLKGATLSSFINPKDYDMIIGVGRSMNEFYDLISRVAIFDEFTDGNYTAESEALYASLRGTRTEKLDCHSNGAMVCLAALSRGGATADLTAGHVRLFGPQITANALERWQQLISSGKTKSVEINVIDGDPIAPLSYGFGEVFRFMKVGLPLPSAGFISLDMFSGRMPPGIKFNRIIVPECQAEMAKSVANLFACHDAKLYLAKAAERQGGGQ
jgi:hypothetical protein